MPLMDMPPPPPAVHTQIEHAPGLRSGISPVILPSSHTKPARAEGDPHGTRRNEGDPPGTLRN
ncbi:hypothetical protein, partial [Nocardia vulneris]